MDVLGHIANGRTDLVRDFLDAGHSAAAHDGQGVTLLQWCAYYGDVSAIRLLLERGAKLATLGENLDLNGAAFHGHWQLCEFVLQQGADPNHALVDTGETPLHNSLCRRNASQSQRVVEVLLAFGADPRRTTIPGAETGSFMRDARTRGEMPLHRAAAYANEDTIKSLLAAGAPIDARDANGDSPLSWASWHLRPDSILQLLCFGKHQIHPDREPMSDSLLGRPRFKR